MEYGTTTTTHTPTITTCTTSTITATAIRQQRQQPFHGLKDWTNKNIFASSIDDETLFIHSYQNQESIDMENSNNVQEMSAVVDEGHSSGQPITALQAAWNVTNAIQGMFIVGLPIAVKVGGWWTIAAILAVVTCIYFKVCISSLVIFLCMLLFFFFVHLYSLIFVKFIDKSALMMLVTTALLGCAFLDSIRVVSNLSLINAISHLIINAIIFIYCLFQVSVPFTFDIRTMPTVIGVVVFGYTSHIFLPSLEASMEVCKFNF
ncbi:hypothetical protein LOAG_18125 [Loa loa]|uniref:Amino acid transporter transmembrane domain-containing protein n=1 Tax=Loa loa TaxID=7209 RepID=A0A1S0UI61_LOALO|nr:hypothetical protein LOAG_18125 [Loa loa]EJD74577.1 hypothetical protein LOAG_18125 [Loa loa]